MITLSTRHLSADGTRACLDENTPKVDVTAQAALAMLKAFAAITPLQLAGIDAKIYLSGPKEKIAVQNTQGKLLVALMPEVFNTWQESTPEETMVRLTGEDSAASDVEIKRHPPRGKVFSAKHGTTRVRGLLGSRWTLGAVVVIAITMSWLSFGAATPAGVKMVHDSAKITQLDQQFDGHYGVGDDPGQTFWELGHGKYRTWQRGATKAGDILMAEMDYKFGVRDGVVVLVVANGAVLEPMPDGSLRFLDIVYPRRGHPRP